MIGGKFVIDAVVHAYNHLPSNWADPVLGEAMVELAYHLAADPPDPRYAMSREDYLIDWQVPDVANFVFGESDTDVAVMHPLAIAAFKDGYSSVEKAAEALERYPTRFIGAYACVDPLLEKQALESMRVQADLLKPLGLKLYPTSWDGKNPVSWRMDDPKLIYPLYEQAQKLGFGTVAVHKAVPIGPFAVGDAYNPSDIENAATDFPDLNFEIVHGGLAFLEEDGMAAWRGSAISPLTWKSRTSLWNVARAPLPKRYSASVGLVVPTCLTGCSGVPAERWRTINLRWKLSRSSNFLKRCWTEAGLFKPVRQLTDQDKANMLAGTFARLHNLDLEAIKAGVKDDEFSRPDGSPPAVPFSTLSHMKPGRDDLCLI